MHVGLLIRNNVVEVILDNGPKLKYEPFYCLKQLN